MLIYWAIEQLCRNRTHGTYMLKDTKEKYTSFLPQKINWHITEKITVQPYICWRQRAFIVCLVSRQSFIKCRKFGNYHIMVILSDRRISYIFTWIILLAHNHWNSNHYACITNSIDNNCPVFLASAHHLRCPCRCL